MNYTSMTDNQLFDLKNEMTVIIGAFFNPWLNDECQQRDIESREAALETLHYVRMELWRRGFTTPDAELRETYERRLAQGAERLAKAEASGDIARDKIYVARNMIRDHEDKLAWIAEAQ